MRDSEERFFYCIWRSCIQAFMRIVNLSSVQNMIRSVNKANEALNHYFELLGYALHKMDE